MVSAHLEDVFYFVYFCLYFCHSVFWFQYPSQAQESTVFWNWVHEHLFSQALGGMLREKDPLSDGSHCKSLMYNSSFS